MVFNDSAIHNNSSTSNLDSAFDTESPVDCFILHIIAYYLIGLFSLSFIFNVILIVVFYLNKDLRTPLNYFIIVIVMFNLFGTCTELPIVITSHLKCRFVILLISFSPHVLGLIKEVIRENPFLLKPHLKEIK